MWIRSDLRDPEISRRLHGCYSKGFQGISVEPSVKPGIYQYRTLNGFSYIIHVGKQKRTSIVDIDSSRSAKKVGGTQIILDRNSAVDRNSDRFRSVPLVIKNF